MVNDDQVWRGNSCGGRVKRYADRERHANRYWEADGSACRGFVCLSGSSHTTNRYDLIQTIQHKLHS